jgi:HK97 family phage portal protein
LSDSSFWQRLLAPFRRQPKDLVRPDDPMRYWGRFRPHIQAAGIVVTNDTALEISVVWACVTAITNAIASCRWNVYTLDAKGQRKNLAEDPLSYLLNVRPNDDMPAIALREVLLFSATTWGNGYAEIVKSLNGKITSLWPILPHRVQPRRDPETLKLYYEVAEQNGGMVRLEPEQMFHIRGPGITGLMGDNTVARAALSMSLAAAQERFASTYFGNNTQIGGVIEYPKKMSDEAHKNLKDGWEDVHKGPDKAHKVAILEDGAKWVQGETKASDAQLVESRKFQIEEICFLPGTQVITARGPEPIETVAAGDMVLTHKGRWRRVRNAMSRAYEGPVVTVRAKGLLAVTATANHPFFAQGVEPSREHAIGPDGEAQWVAAGDLRPSIRNAAGDRSRQPFHCLTMPRLTGEVAAVDLADYVGAGAVVEGDTIKASANHRATPVIRKPEMGYSLGWLCGLFLADGSATDHQVVFYLGAHETDATAELTARLDSVFGVGCTTVTTPGNVARTVVSNRVLSDFFSRFGHASHEKAMPEWCLSAPPAFRDGMIDGLVAGDGCVSRGYTLLRTTSLALAWQTRLLLWAVGRNGNLESRPSADWKIEGRSGPSRDMHTVSWRTSPARRGSMGVADGHVYFALDHAETWTHSGTVHNLEVEEDESYTTVGGAVHNCRWFGVPPHKVQHLDRATFNNIEHLSIEFVRDALTPWAVRMEQEADFKLVPTRGLRRQTKLDMGWLTHGDFKSRMEGYQMGRRMGVYSINDILHREGENTIGAPGDTRIVEINMQTLEQLEAGANLPSKGGGDGGGNAPAGDGTDTGDDGQGGDGADGVGGAPANIATDALTLLFAATLERYQSRLTNREADLRRGGASDQKVGHHLAEERVKLRPWVLEQAADAMGLAMIGPEAVLLSLDLIDNGTDPRVAAERLVAQGKRAA